MKDLDDLEDLFVILEEILPIQIVISIFDEILEREWEPGALLPFFFLPFFFLLDLSIGSSISSQWI